MGQMGDAVRDQLDHAARSKRTDRRGWTRRQWVDDARKQMGDLNGSVLDLLNGHPIHMLAEVDALRTALTSLAEAAGRVLGDSTEASPEVQIELRGRLAEAEDAAWMVLRPAE